MKLCFIAGARPNFMKIGPLMAAAADYASVESLLIHTGQHYDEKLSDLFFRQLGIPEPTINLGVGSASHAVQTARIMERFEPICLEHRPDWVVVVGDVNSTVACGLVAAKLGIGLAHVEAGLRSFDRTMPEEINRIVTDALSDKLFASEPSGMDNLRREGVADEQVHMVGNVMIDTLLRHREQAKSCGVLDDLGLTKRSYGVMTLHRPSNVDDPAILAGLLDVLEQIGAEIPIVWPLHPRAKSALQTHGLLGRVEASERIRLTEPMGYLEFLKLQSDAHMVFTDSGGIQEEASILGVRCLTLRTTTERPVTCTHGTNVLVGTDPDRIWAAYRAHQVEPAPSPISIAGWDGKAAERILEILVHE